MQINDRKDWLNNNDDHGDLLNNDQNGKIGVGKKHS